MRVISQYRNYSGPTAQNEDVEPTYGGGQKVIQKGLRAEPFRWMDVTEWERRQALEAWPAMLGLTEGENPIERLSCFDSLYAQELNGWTDAERKIVEAAIVAGPGNGSDYIVVERPRVPAPWPAYDKLVVAGRRSIDHVVEKIVATVRDLEIDPNVVAMYERENLGRPEVVAALEALNADVPQEELIDA